MLPFQAGADGGSFPIDLRSCDQPLRLPVLGRRSLDVILGASGMLGLMFRTPQVNLYSRDIPRALAFYTELGSVEAFRYPKEGASEHVELRLDGFTPGIATVETAVEHHGLSPSLEGRGMELGLWTDEAAVVRLLGLGARPLSVTHDWLGRLTAEVEPVQMVTMGRFA